MTLMTTISSDGRLWRPFFIQKRMTVDEEFLHQVPSEAVFSYADKGYITGDIFNVWLQRLIREFPITPAAPALLLIDGHRSRENVQALIAARSSGLHIIVLPSKATADLQPLDKVVFAPFKSCYRGLITEIQVNDPAKDKWTVPEIMKIATEALTKTVTTELIASAFANTGISPHDPQHVIDKVCNKLRKKPLVSDDNLRKVVSVVIVQQEAPKKKSSKRLRISGKCITADEAFQEIVEAKSKSKDKRKVRIVAEAGSTADKSSKRKVYVCSSCGRPRKGHPRGRCDPSAPQDMESSSEDDDSSLNEEDPSLSEDDTVGSDLTQVDEDSS